MAGFPVDLISRVRCGLDGGRLTLASGAVLSIDGTQIVEGHLQCAGCPARPSIVDGILDLLAGTGQDAESGHELRLRDEEYTHYRSRADDGSWLDQDRMEILPTLEALGPRAGKLVLELGCGDGRYTLELSRTCSVLAVDFSIVALRHLRERLEPTARVGLILGDVTHLKFEPRSFDGAICTLMSNLPSPAHRQAVYQQARDGLTTDGRFVFSAHHHGLRQIFSGETKEGRYQAGGIYRYHMTARECEREVAPYFREVRVRPIQVFLPLGRTLGLPVVPLSRFFESVPLVNRLGNLLLCAAWDPR